MSLITKFLRTTDNDIKLSDVTLEVLDTGRKMLEGRLIWNPDIYLNFMDCLGNDIRPEQLSDDPEGDKLLMKAFGEIIFWSLGEELR